jgi:hypothetical protein
VKWPEPVALVPPQPGDFCCVPISGDVGLAIEAGQWLAGDRFQPYDHAEVYIGGDSHPAAPYGWTVSAYPDGQGLKPLPCPPGELPGSLWSAGLIVLTPGQRQAICAWAAAHEDIAYSFADYGALVLHTLRIPVPGLREFIASTGHMICSQYVDASYTACGVPLFTDGRWPGYVKPGDLAGLLQVRLAAISHRRRKAAGMLGAVVASPGSAPGNYARMRQLLALP